MKTKWEKGLFFFYAALIAITFLLILAARAGAAPAYGPCQVTNWGSSQVKLTWYNGPYTGAGGAYEVEATFRVTNQDDGSIFVTGTDWWGPGDGANSIMLAHGDFSGHSWKIDNITCIARFPSGPVSQSESGVYYQDFHTMKFYLPGIHSNSAYDVKPESGDYDLNQMMGITVNWPGCSSANPVFHLDNKVYGMAYMVYNQGCYNGQANLIVSFYEPVIINALTIDVYTPSGVVSLPISGQWSFGE